MEAAATKAMQLQQTLQEEVEYVDDRSPSFLLDAIAEIHARTASAAHTERAAAAPAEARTPKGRTARRAVAYSDDEDDEPAPALAPSTDAADEAERSAKRLRSTPGTSEVDDDVLASLGDDEVSAPKRARLA